MSGEDVKKATVKWLYSLVFLLTAVGLVLAINARVNSPTKTIKQNSAKTNHKVVEHSNTSDTDNVKILPKDFSPSGDDMVNLARAMHGAAGQQPDDAPKDKYGLYHWGFRWRACEFTAISCGIG